MSGAHLRDFWPEFFLVSAAFRQTDRLAQHRYYRPIFDLLNICRDANLNLTYDK